MRSHRFLVVTALTLALTAFVWSPASATTVTLTLSPAGPTVVTPGGDIELDLVINTDEAFTLDNLTVDLLSPFALEGTKTGFEDVGGFSNAFAALLLGGGIPLAVGDNTFNSFFDVFFDLSTPPGETMQVDAKANLDNQCDTCAGDAISNLATFETPRGEGVPEPATMTLLAIGGLVSVYVRSRRRGGDA